MNRALRHFCAHTGYIGPGEPHEDSEMSEMTLLSRHRIRSEAEHATSRSRRLPTILSFTRGWGRNIFVSFKLPRQGNKPRTLGRICKDVEAGGQICLTLASEHEWFGIQVSKIQKCSFSGLS